MNRFAIILACFFLLSCNDTPEELLTNHPWKMEATWQQVANSQLFYQRGNPNSTLNLEFESVKFNMDGTGLYTDNHGASSPINWHFTDSSKTQIGFLYHFLPPASGFLNITKLTKDRFEYVVTSIQGTTPFLSIEHRVPK